MARFYADLPLPVAGACVDAVRAYAKSQQAGGDDRPVGQIRTEVLTDLILRPWDTSRPPVTAELTIHLTVPTGAGASLNEEAAQADVDGHTITADQCRDVLSQLHSSRLYLALHDHNGSLQAVASHSQLRRAAHRRRRRNHERPTSVTRLGPECESRVQRRSGASSSHRRPRSRVEVRRPATATAGRSRGRPGSARRPASRHRSPRAGA